jgi:ketosteroid isomerase-like protein
VVTDSVQTNAQLARRSLELWNSGGVDAVADNWAPDIVFYDPADAIDGGTFRGEAEVAARFRAVTASLGRQRFELRSVED